jgi:hypothetical protein
LRVEIMKVDPNLLAAMDSLKVMKAEADAAREASRAAGAKEHETRIALEFEQNRVGSMMKAAGLDMLIYAGDLWRENVGCGGCWWHACPVVVAEGEGTPPNPDDEKGREFDFFKGRDER